MSIVIPVLLPVISDFIFKLIFGDQRNVDILGEFLKAVLDIPDSEYDHITVVDPICTHLINQYTSSVISAVFYVFQF